eukprot:6214644-Pleurochrysis_carterae.AAC.3
MQMRMNDTQSRNLQSQTDPRDRGSSASIARPRKLSILLIRLQGRYTADLTTYMKYTKVAVNGHVVLLDIYLGQGGSRSGLTSLLAGVIRPTYTVVRGFPPPRGIESSSTGG